MRTITIAAPPGRRLPLAYGAAALVAAALVFLAWPGAPEVPAAQLWVEPVRSGDLNLTLSGTGELVPADLRILASLSGGTVTAIHAQPGARLEAGAPILSLSNPELEQKRSAADKALAEKRAERASLAAELAVQRLEQESRLDELKARLAGDTLELAAYEKLVAQSVVSRIQYDKLKLSVAGLKAQVAQGEKRLVELQAALQARVDAARLAEERAAEEAGELRRQVEALVLRAEQPGVLHELMEGMSEGAPVLPGAVLAKLARSERLEAELKVPAARLKELKVGQEASVDLRGARISGRIGRIDPRVSNDQVRLRIALPEDLPAEAGPGLPVTAEIETGRLAGVVYVSRPVGVEADSRRSLFSVAPDGERLTRREVQFGRVGGQYIVITSGLAAGERLVLSDLSAYGEEEVLRVQGALSPPQATTRG